MMALSFLIMGCVMYFAMEVGSVFLHQNGITRGDLIEPQSMWVEDDYYYYDYHYYYYYYYYSYYYYYCYYYYDYYDYDYDYDYEYYPMPYTIRIHSWHRD